MIIHTVQGMECPYDIAAKYSVPVTKLLSDNGKGERLCEGEELIVIMPTKTAVVRGGDTLHSFAARYGVKESAVIAANPELATDKRLRPGRILAVKQHNLGLGAATAVGITDCGTENAHLERALPYLTYVIIRALEVTEDGIRAVRDARGAVARCTAEGKPVLLGVTDTTGGAFLGNHDTITEALPDICRKMGACGICLIANEGAICRPKEYCSFVLAVRKRFIGCELMLFTALTEGAPADAAELADGAVFITSGTSRGADRAAMERLSAIAESSKIFVDLPSRIRMGDGDACPAEISELCRKGGYPLTRTDELFIKAECRLYKRGRREQISVCFPSLEYIKAKLVSLAELGFAGVFIDIDKLDIRYLTMFNAAFRRADYELKERYIF